MKNLRCDESGKNMQQVTSRWRDRYYRLQLNRRFSRLLATSDNSFNEPTGYERGDKSVSCINFSPSHWLGFCTARLSGVSKLNWLISIKALNYSAFKASNYCSRFLHFSPFKLSIKFTRNENFSSVGKHNFCVLKHFSLIAMILKFCRFFVRGKLSSER